MKSSDGLLLFSVWKDCVFYQLWYDGANAEKREEKPYEIYS